MVSAPDVVQPWMPRAARESDACLWHVSLMGGARRRGCAAAGVPECFDGPLDRDAPEREPALELGLDGQVGADLRLEAQLALVVALLRAARGHERIEGATLVVVDPVDRLVACVAQGEDRA